MAIRQSLSAMDAVMRANARDVGLDAADVLVVLLLGQQPSFAATEVAHFSGRPRQQVQRTLMALARRGLVHTGKLPSGRVAAWALTAEGRDVLRRLHLRLAAHLDMLGDRADLTPVAVRLEQIVSSIVNRPSGYGWLRGLQALPEARLDPEWDRRGVDEEHWWMPLHEPILPRTF